MKHLRAILALTLSVVLLLLSLPVNAFGAAGGDANGTGLKEPTTAQKQWIKDNFPVVQKVRLNQIAFQRINADRVKKGQPSLNQKDVQLAPVGQELVLGTTSGSTITASEALLALPGSVDNSASPAFPPIRSQGSLGSCAAWATTYYQFTYENNLARGRTASAGDNNVIFSPKWTYNMINGGANNGAYFSDTYSLEMKNGAASWAEFPYDSNYLAWDLDPAAWRDALNYRPLSQGQLSNSNVDALISDIKTQLANGHVLVIGTYVYSWVQYTLGNDPATADDNAYAGQKIAGYMSNTSSGAHAMTVVGYNDSLWVDLNGNGLVDNGEKGAFKIANSWGTGDWNAGYRWVSYDALRTASSVPAYATWPTANRASGGIFWSGNIFTLTARADYSPTFVAQVTLNQNKRNQMAVSLGTASTGAVQPTTIWNSGALKYSGGAYAFDGTTIGQDGAFVLDFSDLAANAIGNTRWFVGIIDSTLNDPTTLKLFQLYKVTSSGDSLVASAVNLPQSADAGTKYAWLDYAPNSLNQLPVAMASATPLSGNIPLIVSFDGSASYDPDGQIAGYAWNFGDGASASGAVVSHTYLSAQTFSATLTVTDDKGATASAVVKITTVDPNVITAPSKLTAKISRSNVTLTWADNSNNEGGFYIERSTLTGSVYSAYSVVGQTGANIKTYSQSVAAGSYKYRVRAFNPVTTSPYSNEVAVRAK